MNLDAHLAAIVGGDARAFAAWLAGAEPEVRAALRSFAAVVDVESVLQEALLRVWQVAPRFVSDGKPNGLVRLGVRIARNLAISEVRRTHARPVEDIEAHAEPEPAPTPPDPHLRAAIADCRDKLPDKPRAALDARLADGGAHDDQILADGLRMQKNTFLQNFTRARKLLADCLGKRGVVIGEELAR